MAADGADGPGGALVTFEGGEGAGKSTQIARLRERLLRRGLAVVATREPGGSARAEAIRRVLLAGQAKRFGPLAEAALFAAARADHVRATLRPALARGAVALCDRFADSSRVYQGVVGDAPAGAVERLIRAATGGLAPSLTVILDLPASVGLARARSRRGGGTDDRFEAESLAFHERVREGFLTVARSDPDRCAVVDGDRPPEAVELDVWRMVVARWPGLAADAG